MVVRLSPTGQVVNRQLRHRRANDSFFAAAISPDGSRVAVLGYLGRDTAGDAKDDSAVLWMRAGS